jgi:GTP pyrophosphokinase
LAEIHLVKADFLNNQCIFVFHHPFSIMNDLEALANLTLAPYILKATALIGVRRKIGGNQFRHSFSTLGILLDYKYYNESILLKASLLHDLLEDLPSTQVDEIKWIDNESHKVVELVLEVTRREEETKVQYLQRVLNKGSKRAKILKCADRISNLTDLHRDTFTDQKISDYLDQTEEFVIPMAEMVNPDMLIELKDLVKKRRNILLILEDN